MTAPRARQVRLVIARHGNTFAPGDTVTRVGARTDLPLAGKGPAQARALGRALKARGLVPDLVYTSVLARTRETAALAQEEMGATVAPVALGMFSEIDYGPDENRPEEEVVARLGEQALKDWDEKAVVPQGWKADSAAIVRGWRDFAQGLLEGRAGRTVLVVTSNGVARFAPHLTGDFDGFRARHPLKLSTAAFGLLVHDGASWHCVEWNTRPDLKDFAA